MQHSQHRATQKCDPNENAGLADSGDSGSAFCLSDPSPPPAVSEKLTLSPPSRAGARLSRARARVIAAAAPAVIKLDTSVVNRQKQRAAYWEKLGDKLEQCSRWLSPEVDQQFANFRKCHQEEVFRTCRGCGNWEALPYQCSLKWCPMCVFKLSRIRQEKLLHWTERIKQPKHVVVTQLNMMMIDRQSFVVNGENVRRLQRSVAFQEVRGGCCSTEVTNKSRGWHLHNHLLVDADWVDSGELARTWASIVGQKFAIVKVKDARAVDYRKEVAKYVCKSSELVSWTPRQIASFVNSLYRTRLFVRFGSLRTEPKFIRPVEHRVCECGCSEFAHTTEIGEILREIARSH